jgi:hypothetical protein
MAFDEASATVGAVADERPADVSPSGAEVQPGHNAPPVSTAGAGEGTLKVMLPGEGRVTLRLPTTVGATEVRIDYDIAHESHGLPNVAVAALVDLPTAAGMHGPKAGVKTTAVKQMGSGVVQNIHLESELRTDGANPSYRIGVGTIVRLGPETSGSLDFIDQQAVCRPGDASSPSKSQVGQLGLSHKFDASTGFRFGLAHDLGDARSLRATIGIDRHF